MRFFPFFFRLPPWVGSSLIYLVVMIGFILWGDQWRELDWRLLAFLYSKSAAPAMNPDVMLIDVAGDPADQALFRRNVARVLNCINDASTANGARPRRILLDIAFVKTFNPSDAVAQSTSALIDAMAKHFNLYATIDILQPNHKTIDPDYRSRHDGRILGMFAGTGHTRIMSEAGVGFYYPRISLGLKTVGVQSIKALPLWVGAASDSTAPRIIRMPSRPTAASAKWVFSYDGNRECRFSGTTGALPEFTDKNIIIGSLTHDISPLADRPGPEVLAWAVNEALQTHKGGVVSDGLFLAAIILIFPLITLVLFQLGLHNLRRLRTNPRLLSLLAGICATTSLALLVIGFRALDWDFTRVTLPVISIIAATALIALYRIAQARRMERIAKLKPDDMKYDVFVSYTRPQQAWVKQNVCAVLDSLSGDTYKKTSYFFDTRSIEVGDSWYNRIALAINASKIFLAVISKDYFDKVKHPMCVTEIELAAIRHAGTEGEIILIMNGASPEVLPPGYRQHHVIDADDPELGRKLTKAMEKLSTMNT